MNTNTLREFIDKLLREQPKNSLKVYFSYWNAPRYISFLPQISTDVQDEILSAVLQNLSSQLGNAIVAYNPVGVADGEIEKLDKATIEKINAYCESITDETVIKDMNTLKVDKIDFYCLEINLDGQAVFLFRQFHKLKRLRKGILTRIVNNELQITDSNFLGIDEAVDIILFDDDVYLINHISLERIFKYRDEFLKKTNEALGELLTQNIISNIDQFTEDCRNDIRIMKRFTNIMTKERLPLFFDNYEKVPDIVGVLGLDIDFDEDGRLVYREKSQLFHIINLLSDAYFKSLIAERAGVAKTEGEI